MDRLVFSIFSSISVTCANLTSKMYKDNIKKQSHDINIERNLTLRASGSGKVFLNDQDLSSMAEVLKKKSILFSKARFTITHCFKRA